MRITTDTKRIAFTLGEVLITLGIIGALMLMIIPGVIKNVSNRVNVALLQKTISDIEAVAKADLANHGGDYSQSDLCKAPEKFLKRLDPTVISTYYNRNHMFQGFEYHSMSGRERPDYSLSEVESTGFQPTTDRSAALLKTGVAIAFGPCRNYRPNEIGFKTKPEEYVVTLMVYLNGTEKNKIIGVNTFSFYIYLTDFHDAYDLWIHPDYFLVKGSAGDVHALDTTYNSQYKSFCEAYCYDIGITDVCTDILFKSGFDPDYMKSCK